MKQVFRDVKKSQYKLSIVIPCYNEEKNIVLIIQRFSEVINRDDIEVILVNNGSNDNSEEIIKNLLPKYNFLKTIKIALNQGYGFGILSGLKIAQGEFVGWTHADMQTDPNDVLKALEIIEKNNSSTDILVKGSRKNREFFDNIFTVGMAIFETMLLRKFLWEINAQPNIFHKSFMNNLGEAPYDFSLDLYVYYMAKIKGLKIIRFPVLFPQRIHGFSSWNNSFADKWKFIKRTIAFSFKLRKNIKK
ncbi:MAG TPA: glycosyltransferase family 2 protein [Rickettsiales bacterium]|nr:glycosyltransferase family 2 protein [Rickettsiales bacterium]